MMTLIRQRTMTKGEINFHVFHRQSEWDGDGFSTAKRITEEWNATRNDDWANSA